MAVKKVPHVNFKLCSFLRILTIVAFVSMTVDASAARVFLTDDTYTWDSASSVNYGRAPSLRIASGCKTYLRFDLSTLPPDTVADNVAKATLTVWVSQVIGAGWSAFQTDSMTAYRLHPLPLALPPAAFVRGRTIGCISWRQGTRTALASLPTAPSLQAWVPVLVRIRRPRPRIRGCISMHKAFIG